MNGGISRHVPYSQRGEHLSSSENVELKVSRILRENPIAQKTDYHTNAMKNVQEQNAIDESKFLYRGEASSPICNVRSLQGHVGYRHGHFSI